METCVNCACQFLDPCQNSDDLNVFSVYEPLSTIFKLNYLSAFTNSSESGVESENKDIWKLCENCLGVFTNLLGFYHDFNLLQSLESKLFIEIQKLDYFIQNHQQQQQQQQKKQNPIVKQKKKKEVESSHRPNPIVILHRVENEPEAQKYLSNIDFTKLRKKAKKKNPKNIVRVGPSFSKSKVTSIKHKESITNSIEIKDIVGNMNNLYADVLFIPSQQDRHLHQQQGKKRKRGTSNSAKNDTRLVRTPEEIAEAKKRVHLRKKIQKKQLTDYKRRKTQAPNPCWDCEMDFPTQDDCYAHTMKEHFQQGNHVCKNCSKRCTTSHHLKVHEELTCLSLKPGEILCKV